LAYLRWHDRRRQLARLATGRIAWTITGKACKSPATREQTITLADGVRDEEYNEAIIPKKILEERTR